MAKFRTHYDNLKVSRNAPQEVIKAAYRVLSQKYHPDLNQNDSKANDIMQLINEAYAILSDPYKREEHDKWIAYQEKVLNEPDELNRQRAAQEKRSKEYESQQAAQKEQSRSFESPRTTQHAAQTKSEPDREILVKGIFWLLVVVIILWLVFSEKTVNYPAKYVDEKPLSNVDLASKESTKEFLNNLDTIKRNEPKNYQTSFDCSKAKSISETLICQNIDLAQADKELAELVRIAKLEIVYQVALTNRLKKQWNYREKNCKDVECLNIWYGYQKETLTKIIQTKNANIGLAIAVVKPKPTPFTGYMDLKDITEAVVPFQLKTPSDGNNYLIKMENSHTQTSYRFFVRSGDVLETKVPVGVY